MAPLLPSKHIEALFARYHDVPDTPLITIEHPGIIENLDKGIASLGGEKQLTTFVQADASQRCLRLHLRHGEPFRKPILAKAVATENIVLRVTVPKRTGRKRKRGSDESFACHPESSSGSQDADEDHEGGLLMRSLRDNPDKYAVEAVGMVDETHRFRGLPDFQWSFATSPLASSLQASVLKPEYESLRKFKYDTDKGVKPFTDMIPPPALAQNTIPFNYGYRQNPTVKLTVDSTGKQKTVNMSAPPKIATRAVPYDCPASEIPTSPPPGIADEKSLDRSLQTTIIKLRALMQERPILTRRVMLNRLGASTEYDLKHAVQYTGYVFKSGPWRDALIAFGIDPRTDAKYRGYQTLVFKIVIRDDSKDVADNRSKWNRSLRVGLEDNQHNPSHLFDGLRVIPDGKVWQACDITDPLLRGILSSDSPRDECEILQDGWYHNGAWAKLRCIMRDKIALIMAGVTPADSIYEKVVTIPNHLDQSNVHKAIFTRRDGPRSMELASSIRGIANIAGHKPDKVSSKETPDGDSLDRGASSQGLKQAMGEGELVDMEDDDEDDVMELDAENED